MPTQVATPDDLAAEATARDAADKAEALIRQNADAMLLGRIVKLEVGVPPVPPDPPVPPTPSNVTHVATTAELLDALSRNLGPGASIQMDPGGALAQIKLTTAHRGYNGQIPVDLGGRTVSCSGGYGFLSWGARDIAFGHFALAGGNVDQMGAITIGQSTSPAPTLRVRWHDFTLDKTVTGPAKVGSTANATAHGVYISRATAPHEDIEIDTFTADGSGGLAAMIHMYDGSGTTGDRRLHVHDGKMTAFAQAVMAYEEGTGADPGSSDDAILERLTFAGCGIVLRLPSGSGLVRNCTSTGTVSAVTSNIGAGWFLDPSNSLA